VRIHIAAGTSLLALLALAPSASAQKARIFGNGLFNVSEIEWDATRNYTEFAESSSIASHHTVDTGVGFEIGLRYDFAKHVGAAASFSMSDRDASATFSTGLPHPLFFNRKREVSGEVTGLGYKENAEHVDLVLHTTSGSWDLALLGGVSFFQVETDLIDRVQYNHTYPYDTATVTGTTQATVKDSPIGFNVGAMVDYRVGKHFAIGATARFSRATVKLEELEDASAELDAGGFQVGAGIRVIF
jgi:hypothetical protein